MKLPIKFIEKMQTQLQDEFQSYLDSYNEPRWFGLRVNTSKISVEEFLKISPFKLEPIPWIDNGFYYDGLIDEPGKHPYYNLGLYYLQEPSAMTPANRLLINDGDFVLDLCAAPGGKSTELGAKLNGTGLLVANDISNSRAKALLKNLEQFGIKNSFVMSETPEKIAQNFQSYFDKILIDAPCSGEGMFRKDHKMIASWEINGPEYYHDIQVNILDYAYQMLKKGGLIMYSTCTFDELENEVVINQLLNKYHDLSIEAIMPYKGFKNGNEPLIDTVRIWPHKMQGEGHYLALIKKDGELTPNAKTNQKNKVKISEETELFLKLIPKELSDNLFILDDKLYNLPSYAINTNKLRLLRNGLLLGVIKAKRFEPSQALAMHLKHNDFANCINLNINDIRVNKYIKGETLSIEDFNVKNGWCLVLIDSYPVGFGKVNNKTLKNKYAQGWIR